MSVQTGWVLVFRIRVTLTVMSGVMSTVFLTISFEQRLDFSGKHSGATKHYHRLTVGWREILCFVCIPGSHTRNVMCIGSKLYSPVHARNTWKR